VPTQRTAVFLRDGTTGEPVEATRIDGIALAEIEVAQTAWAEFLKTALESATEWPEHSHWNWVFKAELALARRYYRLVGIEAGDGMQGLMTIAFHQKCRIAEQTNQGMVYIDYLSSAPWNLPQLTPTPRYKAIGQVLIASAIEASFKRGWQGRIGLHSLPQAESFYARCGMTDMGKDSAYEGLRYYEMTALQAENYVSRR
jgi:hypothetical protein